LVELHPVVDLGQGKLALDRLDGHHGVQAGAFGQQPAAVGLAREALDAQLVLADQQVVGQRVQRAVLGELLAPVVGLRGLGEDLDDDGGVEQDVQLFGLEARPAANDAGVRIGIQVGTLS